MIEQGDTKQNAIATSKHQMQLSLLWSHRRRLEMILSSASDVHELIKGPPQAQALTLRDEGRASEP